MEFACFNLLIIELGFFFFFLIDRYQINEHFRNNIFSYLIVPEASSFNTSDTRDTVEKFIHAIWHSDSYRPRLNTRLELRKSSTRVLSLFVLTLLASARIYKDGLNLLDIVINFKCPLWWFIWMGMITRNNIIFLFIN